MRALVVVVRACEIERLGAHFEVYAGCEEVCPLSSESWSVFGYFQLALEAQNNSAMPSAAHDMLSVCSGLRGELWIMV